MAEDFSAHIHIWIPRAEELAGLVKENSNLSIRNNGETCTLEWKDEEEGDCSLSFDGQFPDPSGDITRANVRIDWEQLPDLWVNLHIKQESDARGRMVLTAKIRRADKNSPPNTFAASLIIDH